jgi:hypothetical protein
VSSQDTTNNVLIDVDSKYIRELLGDMAAAESRISVLHADDRCNTDILCDVDERSLTLHRTLMRYVHDFFLQVSKTAQANGNSSIEERLAERDIKSAVKEIKPFLDRDGKFNVLARMRDFNGFDLLALLDDDLIRLKLKAPARIARYAVVGPRPWMRNLLELMSSVIKTEVRAFDPDEETAAWEWVGAQQALLPE